MPQELKHWNGPFEITCWFYDEFVEPRGALPVNPAAHALWHYYVTASKAHHQVTKGLHYEGAKQAFHGRQLFESVAKMYGVSPSAMSKFWEAVEKQQRLLGLDHSQDLPDKFKFKGIYNQ